MERLSFMDRNCSIARSADVLGDWWNILIVRESLWGTTKFDEYQRNLDISKGILSKRLKLLQDHEILVKTSIGTSTEYSLTEKGRALQVIIVAMLQWGDKWNPLPTGAPVIPIDRRTGAPIPPVSLIDINGEKLEENHLGLLPGPGADDATRNKLETASKRRKDRATTDTSGRARSPSISV
ncbi:helix-turn-helix transcriptional regulator [Pseudomonas sp. J452]|uniref:winged helix-turn-helix transcriptional regulator n=1 Tax=Pseudomonas sp. J452 TaxID=2898441 RepID=UPI0021AE297A|nr:helix-turn-helix domain-containing protein [Pseudomonas sp. J452]UUY08396.1 helix-turn-helix transcriptional regulator [Pseudomonas sp. J452]